MSITYQKFALKLKRYLSSESIAFIKTAYTMAKDAHRNQHRKSKEPFINHPLAVAYTLAQLEQDASVVAAGLLHDTVEDCQVTIKELEGTFGKQVALLVDGVTKIGQLPKHTKKEMQAENYRKMLWVMANDQRVILIKLADRLDNMRTLTHLSKQKQKIIAQETLDIYAPFAHRLGIGAFRWELEDLAFSFLKPKTYTTLKENMDKKRPEREKMIHKVVRSLHKIIHTSQLEADMQGRPKHLYSIHKKMVNSKLDIDEIYDVLALRICTNTVKDCYTIIGIVHNTYKPIAGRFKDYIALPKPNMYQSLHTTILDPEGTPIEVQVRTHEMHAVAEYGMASHWHYKHQKGKKPDTEFLWLRQLLESQKDGQTSGEFVEELKMDLLMDDVFVFTPKGQIKVLPKGACALDFAYAIHTEVGHSCMGARINGKIVPLNYVLKNGDRIEIIQSEKPMPSLDALAYIKTRQARTKIKEWFKKIHVIDAIEKGRLKLERLSLVTGQEFKALFTRTKQKALQKAYHCPKNKDLFLKIGQGDISAKEVILYLLEETEKTIPKHQKQSHMFPRSIVKLGHSPVRILGEKSIQCRLSQCCHPLPGDAIKGLAIRGKGVSIHREDCRYVNFTKKEQKQEHKFILFVEWDPETMYEQEYEVRIEIEAFDRQKLLQEILMQIFETETVISNVAAKILHSGTHVQCTLQLRVRDVTHFQEVKAAMLEVADVYSITRVMPVDT